MCHKCKYEKGRVVQMLLIYSSMTASDLRAFPFRKFGILNLYSMVGQFL